MPSHVASELVQIRGFFEPNGGNASIELQDVSRNESAHKKLQAKMSWPNGAERATVTLLYNRLHITDMELGRWPNAQNIRVATDIFFDSERKFLKAGLFSLSQKNNQGFEKATTRLLTLLGIPAINYSSADSRRPDLAAILMRLDKNPLVVLGECTRERPIEKLSALRERASELSELLQDQADVLPLVFAQCDPVQSDYDSAAEHGIALVGKQEINQLFQWLSSDVSVENVIEFFQSLIQASNMASLMRQTKSF